MSHSRSALVVWELLCAEMVAAQPLVADAGPPTIHPVAHRLGRQLAERLTIGRAHFKDELEVPIIQ